MPRTEKGTTSKASSTHKKPTDKKPTASHQKDKSHHPATLKDLGELDLKKYDDAITKALKLEEEKADLNEECDTKDSEITRLQQQYEEEAGSNRANVNRLTDIISALEEQRIESFELLQTYQQRIVQLSDVIRKYEKDEMGGERKKVMIANISSLEDLVQSQKETIAVLNSDRSSLQDAHKEELGVLQHLCDQKMKDVEGKREALDKADKRSAAIEMACARLTKQITEMHRKDGVKTAEIEALKKLLTDNVLNQSQKGGSGSGDKITADTGGAAETESPRRAAAPGSPNPVTLRASSKAQPNATVSPKRKLGAALETSRTSTNGSRSHGTFQKDRDNAEFLRSTDEDRGGSGSGSGSGALAMTGQRPSAPVIKQKALSPAPEARRREKRQNDGSKSSPSAGTRRGKAATQQQQQQQHETTAADAVAGRMSTAETKGRTTKQAAQQREQEIATERAHQMEVKRRRAVREKNARIRNIRSFDLMAESVELEPSQEPENHSKNEGKDGKDTGAKVKSGAYGRATTAPASSSSSESVTSLGADSASVPRGPRGRSGTRKEGGKDRKKYTTAAKAAKTPLKVVIGERKQYDPSLFTLLSSLDS
jgi:hypothetical protein